MKQPENRWEELQVRLKMKKKARRAQFKNNRPYISQVNDFTTALRNGAAIRNMIKSRWPMALSWG